MQHLTQTKQRDILHTQNNTEEIHNSNSNSNEKGFEREQIPNSPFWIIGEPQGGYAAVMAEYQITNKFNTKQEIVEAIENNHWEIIMRMIGIVVEKMTKEIYAEHANQTNKGKNNNKKKNSL